MININNPIKIVQDEFFIKGLYISITLEGLTSFKGTKNRLHFENKGSFTTLFTVQHVQGVTELISERFSSITLFVKEEFFPKAVYQKLCKEVLTIPTNPKISKLAQELFYVKLTDSLDKIFAQSKALEIIYHLLDDITKDEKHPTVKFSAYDIKALHGAKEILSSTIVSPPSIKELAKEVNLNEFKLKTGYKKFFKVTPYETLLMARMERAKELLLKSENNVTEIAELVGYKHIQSFTTAFLKYYGQKPKDLKKEREQYY